MPRRKHSILSKRSYGARLNRLIRKNETEDERIARLSRQRYIMEQKRLRESEEERSQRRTVMKERIALKRKRTLNAERSKRLRSILQQLPLPSTEKRRKKNFCHGNLKGLNGTGRSDIPEDGALISRVYRYLREEYEQLQELTGNSSDLSPLADILKRTAAATGVSEHTVTAILEEEWQQEEEASYIAALDQLWTLNQFNSDDIRQEEEREEYQEYASQEEADLGVTLKIEVEAGVQIAQSPVDNAACASSTVKTEPDPLTAPSFASPLPGTLVTVTYEPEDHQYTQCPSLAHVTSDTLTTVKIEPDDDELPRQRRRRGERRHRGRRGE